MLWHAVRVQLMVVGTIGWLYGLGGYLLGGATAVVLGFMFRSNEATPEPEAAGKDETVQAAYRILARSSQNPEHYSHDERYVLWFASSKIAKMVSVRGFDPVAEVACESEETLNNLLLSCGYDIQRLTDGEVVQRLKYAMEADMELFADIHQKYGNEPEGQSQ